MSAPLSIVAAPTPGQTPAKWWPDLYLRRGNKIALITPEQCGVVRELYNRGRGFSEISQDIYLHDVTGEKIGHVSYNGRVWLHDVGRNIEVPVAGKKTCKQCDAEGWR